MDWYGQGMYNNEMYYNAGTSSKYFFHILGTESAQIDSSVSDIFIPAGNISCKIHHFTNLITSFGIGNIILRVFMNDRIRTYLTPTHFSNAFIGLHFQKI